MTEPNEIKQLLERYFQAVDSQKSDHPLDLSGPLMALEDLAQSPQPSLPGRLAHYLQSRSYRKAYSELGGHR